MAIAEEDQGKALIVIKELATTRPTTDLVTLIL